MLNTFEELRYLIKAADKEGELHYANLLKPYNITPSQNEILKILSVKDGLSISQIGDLLICGSDNPSRLVERLLSKAFIEKRKDPNDARMSNIFITEKGQALLEQTSVIEQSFNDHIAQTLQGKIDVAQLIDVLKVQVDGTKTLAQIHARQSLEIEQIKN